MAGSFERLTRRRLGLRLTVEECIASLETGLDQIPRLPKTLDRTLRELQVHGQQLREYDEEYQDALVDAVDYTEASYNVERNIILGYQRKIQEVTDKVVDALTPQQDGSIPVGGTASSMTSQKLSVRLPKITLRKFSGELTEWLGWWAQFKSIHDSEDVHVSDKFTYLFDSLKEGSRAYTVARRFPQSVENYPKAVDALKERFGNPKLLRQVYVRELIKMILDTRNKEKTPLGTLYDNLEAALRSLQSLGVKTDQMVELFFPMVESSLPEDTLLAWQRSHNYGKDGSMENPPCTELDYLMAFLKTEIDHEETRKLARDGFGLHSGDSKKSHGTRMKKEETEELPTAASLYSGSTATNQKSGCIFCEHSHASKNCRKAGRMTHGARKEILIKKRACFVCFKIGCGSRGCKEDVKCTKCEGRHYAQFCPRQPNAQEDRHVAQAQGTPAVLTGLNICDDVALMTLMVRIVNPVTRKSKEVRLLMDTGSHRSFITERAAKAIGLVSKGTVEINQTLFGGTEIIGVPHNVYDFNIACQNSRVTLAVTMMDQPQICKPISRVTKGPWMTELKRRKIFVTDLDPSKPADIDVLIGGDYDGRFRTGRMLTLDNGLTAVETIFGWTLIGPMKPDTEALSLITMTVSCSTIAELWSLETIGIRDPAEHKSKEERERETQEHFARTVSQDATGRYSVRLPWISVGAQAALPSNYDVAFKRLQVTSKKLVTLEKFDSYSRIFEEWESEGIISTVRHVDEGDNRKFHYLPHRAVFKDSKTTPVRPVFDASCKVGRNPSLNGCLEKGPNFLEHIPAILLRFRMGAIGVIADIRKAFLMIEVNEEDRDFLRFLWWEDASQNKVKTYQHNRVVFGMNCSPFLLAAVIGHHLEKLRGNEPQMADRIEKSLYVDNLVTAMNSTENYDRLKEVATRTLDTAKMELRQWERSGVIGDGPTTGVLGLNWHKMKDVLTCDILPSEVPTKITKRVMLSKIQTIFDPLGFLAPTVLIPKVLLQQTWLENKAWDTEVSAETQGQFRRWWEEFTLIKDQIQIPRDCSEGLEPSKDKFQIHVFGDASKLAYAAVAFLRVDTGSGVKVHLLQAKTRPAPLKIVSTPRLELLSCSIAARLSSTIRKSLNLEEIPLYHWSDSSTALAWIRRSVAWGTFVGNRVKEILELTPSANWRHVPGELNPADLPSRGISPKKFAKLRWWEGPEWLKLDESQWPQSEPEVDESEVARETKRILTLVAISEVAPLYMPFNLYSLNLRVMSYVFRFMNGLKKAVALRACSENPELRTPITINVKTTPPTRVEIEITERRIFKLIQYEAFPHQESQVVADLRVRRDEDGLIRVETKLVNRDDAVAFRWPVLLPHAHPMVDALIRHTHFLNCHGRAQFLMGKLRETVWIVKGKKAVNRVIRSCVRCKRYDAKKVNVQPSALPADRVKDATAFQVTGVDLAGPLTLRDGSKSYIVLYTCAVYRCVHLEVTESLTTNDFLLSFVRFCKRKRRPLTVYSDNGSNFKGAVNLFELIDWDEVVQRTRDEKVDWHFNPPAAPWWGGWWERLIGSVKDLLRRMLGMGRLTLVELETCLCEVESTINSRPLTFVTEDQDDLVPLTPAMFITCLPVGDVPEAQVVTLDSLGKQRKNLKVLLDELRGRFRKEYLAQLVHRGKEKKVRTFKVGEVVLIEKENEKRIFWPMGRIRELIPGKDGEIRVATVKTSTGLLTRPLQRLFPLEVGLEEIPIVKTIDEKGLVKNTEAPAPGPSKKKVTVAKKKPANEVQVVEPVPVVTRSGRQVARPAKLN